MAEATTQTSAAENAPAINIDNIKTTYANVCRIAQTPNEMIVDFGLNPNFFGNILPEPLKLESRIILALFEGLTTRAADGGNVDAMVNLGWMYEYGRGETQDYQQAATWYQKAADAGNPDAKDWLANHPMATGMG